MKSKFTEVDIIINGESLKDAILSVLIPHKKDRYLDDIDIDVLADEIKYAITTMLNKDK